MALMTPPSDLPAASKFIQNVVSLATVAFQVYEWLWNIPFEVEHIWSKSCSSGVRWRYFWSRYGGLFTQVLHAMFYASIQSHTSVPVLWCRAYHLFHFCMCQIFILSLSASLLHRMYPLYDKRAKIAAFLAILMGVECITSFIWGITFVIRQSSDMKGGCRLTSIPNVSFFFMIAKLLLQGTLWSFACLPPDGLMQPFLSKRVITEASSVFVAIFVLFTSALITIYMSYAGSPWELMDLYHAFWPISLAILSLTNCHLIKSVKLAVIPPNTGAMAT